MAEKFNCASFTTFLTAILQDYSDFKINSETKKVAIAIQQRKVIQEKIENFKSPEAIFGEDYFGPKQVEEAFGIEIGSRIPSVPFSFKELVEARRKNYFLILRVDRDRSKNLIQNYFRKPLDMNNMPYISPSSPGNDKSPFSDTLRPGWALVSNLMIPANISESYKQVYHIISELKHYLTAMMQDTADFRKAMIMHNTNIKRSIEILLQNSNENSKEMGLLNLIYTSPACKIAFHRPAEILYDAIVNPNFLTEKCINHGQAFDAFDYSSALVPYRISADGHSDYLGMKRDPENGQLRAGRSTLFENTGMYISWRGKE